mmetsp:Transcript_4657/g.11713  ORF Transcript_4657/g.11713 Transcript_4657/m.11713 type:complete len:235 (+) Transcript_4657:610-1314(+)
MPRDVQPALRAARQHLGGARAEQHAHREHHRGDREEDQPDHQVPRDGEPRAERAERDRRREQRLERRRAAAPLRPRQLALAVHERRGGEVARRGQRVEEGAEWRRGAEPIGARRADHRGGGVARGEQQVVGALDGRGGERGGGGGGEREARRRRGAEEQREVQRRLGEACEHSLRRLDGGPLALEGGVEEREGDERGERRVDERGRRLGDAFLLADQQHETPSAAGEADHSTYK